MNEATVAWINKLSREAAWEVFGRCCGASWWREKMTDSRPFANAAAISQAADRAFDALPVAGWLEAFASHPRIGDLESLKMRFPGNKEWSAGEQAGAAAADEATLHRLAEANDSYQQRFGYIFIVCASGQTAAEMLATLKLRLRNDDDSELRTASQEQRKITHLRLNKLTAPSSDGDQSTRE